MFLTDDEGESRLELMDQYQTLFVKFHFSNIQPLNLNYHYALVVEHIPGYRNVYCSSPITLH